MDSASHNIDLVPELPAVSLGRMVCLVYLAMLVCLISPRLYENHLSPVVRQFMKQFNMDLGYQMQIINTRIENMVNQINNCIMINFIINL